MQHGFASDSDSCADAIDARDVCLTRRGGLAAQQRM